MPTLKTSIAYVACTDDEALGGFICNHILLLFLRPFIPHYAVQKFAPELGKGDVTKVAKIVDDGIKFVVFY